MKNFGHAFFLRRLANFGVTATIVAVLFITSCQKVSSVKLPFSPPLTANETQLAHRFDQIADIMQKIYKNPKVREEISLAVFTKYYADEVVKLKDMLHPEKSALFKTDKMKASLEKHRIDPDLFSKVFFAVLNDKDYPGLRLFLDSACSFRYPAMLSSTFGRNAGISYLAPPPEEPIDPDGPIGIIDNNPPPDVTIYYPYSENFANVPQSELSILSAHGELDGDYGMDPHGYQVWINDDYAEVNPTQIIGMNGGDLIPLADGNHNTPPPPVGNPQDTIREVFVGFVQCKKQYDHFISLTGNGGGSELRICRGSAYLALDSSKHVPDGTFDKVEVYFKRKEIRKKDWKKVYSVWDPNWKWQNREQVFAIYEEDTDPKVDLTIGMNTTLKILGQEITVAPFTFKYSAKTKDEIIRNFKRQHEEFFVNNKLDQGCGFKSDGASTGLHGLWPIYDCGANVSYTMPEQVTTY